MTSRVKWAAARIWNLLLAYGNLAAGSVSVLGHDYAADAVPLYQHTGTDFTDLGRMTG